MNLQAFRDEHPHCELAPLFTASRWKCVVPDKPPVSLLYPVHACELHHVVGRNPKGRRNDPRNLLHLSREFHSWATTYSLAGRVASCWALKKAGRLDFEFLSELDGACWPGIFSTDHYAAQCREFVVVEAMRRAMTEDVSDSEIRDCGCRVMKGWRCPVHDAP